MAYGPGVNEINYSDLPPTGDTVNSAFQKTQNQFDALYTGLNGDIVRASEADVNTATDTTKLVTPGTLLKGKVNGVASLNSSGKVTETELPLASTTVKGAVELATSAEVLAGTDNERAVTPATLTTKILGTVSEASGVPTGAIIESGSNANGSYVKFADGTMICRKHVTTGNIATAWGILYQSGSSPVGTFPAAFIEKPYCNMMWIQGSNGLAIPAMSSGALSETTGPNIAIIRPNSHAYNGTVYISAIGRWF